MPLVNATMNGQYPAPTLSGPAPYMTTWFDFMAGNRYWELEPYYDVDGGRAVRVGRQSHARVRGR